MNQPAVLGILTTAVGTARRGVDDQATDGRRTVTIPAGETGATLEVPIIDDEVNEAAPERFFSRLMRRQRSRGVTIGGTAARGTITGNDPSRVSLAPTRLSAEDNEAFVYPVTLSRLFNEALGFTWVAGDRTARVDDDLAATTGTATIDVGERHATVTIPINDDERTERSETFTVTLSADTATPLPAGVGIPGGTAARNRPETRRNKADEGKRGWPACRLNGTGLPVRHPPAGGGPEIPVMS